MLTENIRMAIKVIASEAKRHNISDEEILDELAKEILEANSSQKGVPAFERKAEKVLKDMRNSFPNEETFSYTFAIIKTAYNHRESRDVLSLVVQDLAKQYPQTASVTNQLVRNQLKIIHTWLFSKAKISSIADLNVALKTFLTYIERKDC